MNLSDEKIAFKGNGDGIVASFTGNHWEGMAEALIQKLDESPAFYEKSRLALDVGETEIRAADLGRLREQFLGRGITLWAILSTSDRTLANAQALGIPIQLDLKKGRRREEATSTFDGDAAVWIERTLRAGYRVETKCHVVVIGDVNPGAEVISAGNVFVLGRLGGTVHAGAEGDPGAKVYALEFKPTQLTIANVTAAPFSGKIKHRSEFACLKENEIIFESWTLRKRI